MKKKESNVLFIFTLFFVLYCLMTTSVWSAKKIDILSANAPGYIHRMNIQEDRGHSAVSAAFGFGQDEKFTLARKRTDFNNITHSHYTQIYKGIPIWGMETIVSRDQTGQVIKLHGSVIMETPKDILDIPSILDPQNALRRMEKEHMAKDLNVKWSFINEKYGTYIYIDKKDKAHLCYVVSFFADNEKANPSRPIFFIDVKTGKVIHSFDMLAYGLGTGPGGNAKIGQYEYGTDYPGFGVTVNGSTCTMDTANVKTIDLNHGTSGTTAYSYTCYHNTHEFINDSFCPMNDAQYFGQVIYDMYQAWYGLPVLPFKLVMRCHYSNNYQNAFWDGSSMTFGDGDFYFYSLVNLNVSAHEIAHGFTENHSYLIYCSQAGSICESYSDMASEAAEFYMKGANDFKIASEIFKLYPEEALRYMYDPPLDGYSIDHVSEYYEGLEVNYAGGIFNKAFYLIATSSGWSTRMAFDIFTKANVDYWTPTITFQQGAQGALDSAVDYGYPCADVVAAFAAVGIPLSCPAPPKANFTASPLTGTTPLTVYFTDISYNHPTSWSWTFEGGTPATSTAQNPVITYDRAGAFDVTLVATSAEGSDTETKSDYIISTTPSYCASQGNNQSMEWIARVKVGTLNNASGASAYSDFTALTADLPSPSSSSRVVNFELEPGFSGSAYTEYWCIWLDYDRDSDFTDSMELVYSGSGTTMRTGSFNVALAATKGITRMRVAMKWGGAPSSCETFIYGEVEDYTANIGGADISYCSSSGNSQAFEWIGRVQIGSLDHASGASSYSDYTSIITNITRGAGLNIKLTPAFSSFAYIENWMVWIDYNKDGDFVDAGENIFSASGNSTVNGSFTVSSTALRGYTGMRVAMKYGGAPSSCETFGYGEVEDYTANVL